MKEVIIAIAIMLGLFGLLFGFAYIMDSKDCYNKGLIMQKQVKFGFSMGCMLEYEPSKWIPLKQYFIKGK